MKDIKNYHLKKVISKIDHKPVYELSEALFEELRGELIFSRMFCPFPDDEPLLDDEEYIVAFTTYDEYIEHCFEEDLELFDFESSLLYENGEMGEGVVINPYTDNLRLSLEDLSYMRSDYPESRWYIDRKSTHNTKTILKLKKVKNADLNRYLASGDNDLEELLKQILLSKSFVSIKKGDEKVKKGVFRRDKHVYAHDSEGWGHVYTSWDEVRKAEGYVCVPIWENYFRYILTHDFEGVKLNGTIEIPRRLLIENIYTIVTYSYNKNKMADYSCYGVEIK